MQAAAKCTLLTLIVVTLSLLLGCSRHDNSERYILVTVNSKLPYWQTAAAGLSKAAAQYGVKWDVRGPETYDPQAEAEEFRNAAALKPAGLLVSVADAAVMRPEINAAMNAGHTGHHHRFGCSREPTPFLHRHQQSGSWTHGRPEGSRKAAR